jgi:hypothetical protein
MLVPFQIVPSVQTAVECALSVVVKQHCHFGFINKEFFSMGAYEATFGMRALKCTFRLSRENVDR